MKDVLMLAGEPGCSPEVVCIAAIRARAAQIAATLPAYSPNPQVAAAYLAPDPVTAENLSPEEEA